MRYVQTVTNDMIGLRVIGEHILDDILEIRCKTALVASCKMIGYQCIKTRAAGADKQPAVCQTVIDCNRFTVIDHLQRLLRTNRNVQMPCKTVPATHRQDTECRVRAFQPTCHFIHRSVTADSYDCIKTHTGKLIRQFLSVTGPLREHDVRQPLLRIQRLHNQFR